MYMYVTLEMAGFKNEQVLQMRPHLEALGWVEYSQSNIKGC